MLLLEDRTLLSPYLVTTTANSGPGSLRDAITQVNADTSHTLYASPSNSSVDEIDFAITAASDTGGGYKEATGVATITPLSGLPTIGNTVIINGTSETGYGGSPLIALSGASAGSGITGLVVTAGSSTVEGLAIDQFSGDGIDLRAGPRIISRSFV